MIEFKTVDDVLDFAIAEEENAAAFYLRLADFAQSAGIRDLLKEFADEELGHKAKLLAIKDGRFPSFPSEKVMDLKIADYLVEVSPRENLDYREALTIGMKKEKAAFRFYSKLAEYAEDPVLKDVFQGLAQEEAKHKLRFEIEYDENILTED